MRRRSNVPELSSVSAWEVYGAVTQKDGLMITSFCVLAMTFK